MACMLGGENICVQCIICLIIIPGTHDWTLMNLRQMEHLLALADSGSFSRAAESSHLTQSALSRSIQSLEEELGGALFDRIGKRNALTPLGHLAVQRARRVNALRLPMRSNKAPPSSASSDWMLRLSADCVRCELSAARLNDPLSARASRCSICRRFIRVQS